MSSTDPDKSGHSCHMRTLSTCTDCGAMWDQTRETCGVCGSSKRSIDAFVTCSIGVAEEYKVQGRHGEPGMVKPHLEMTSRRRFNRDRQRDETVVIVINSETDDYQQVWTDDDGNIAFEKCGSLRDPNMHGPASYRPTGHGPADAPDDEPTV